MIVANNGHELTGLKKGKDMSMNKFKAAVMCLTVLALFALSIWVSAESANINGKWAMNVFTAKDSVNATIIFQQDGEKLAGIYTGSLGELPVTGTIKGSDVVFQFTRDPKKGYFIYRGKVTDKTMSGNINFAGVARGSFDGKKVE